MLHWSWCPFTKLKTEAVKEKTFLFDLWCFIMHAKQALGHAHSTFTVFFIRYIIYLNFAWFFLSSVHFELYDVAGQGRWFNFPFPHDRCGSAWRDFGNHRREQIVNDPWPPFLAGSTIADWANLQFLTSFVFSDPSNPDSLSFKCRSTHIFCIPNDAPWIHSCGMCSQV